MPPAPDAALPGAPAPSPAALHTHSAKFPVSTHYDYDDLSIISDVIRQINWTGLEHTHVHRPLSDLELKRDSD